MNDKYFFRKNVGGKSCSKGYFTCKPNNFIFSQFAGLSWHIKLPNTKKDLICNKIKITIKSILIQHILYNTVCMDNNNHKIRN